MKTGQVHGKTAKRHTSAEFIDFLSEVVRRARWAKEIHIVLDNLSAHKTTAVDEFLVAHPKVQLHFTPTYSSWLNQVELWFAKIQRDLLARGSSPQSPTWPARSANTSAPTPKSHDPSAGPFPIPPAGLLILSLGQRTSRENLR